MNSKLRDTIVSGLIVAAIGACIVTYADVAVLKNDNAEMKEQIKQLQHENRYYHGQPIQLGVEGQ